MQHKNWGPGIPLPLWVFLLPVLLGVPGCSREIPQEQLQEKNGKHYRTGQHTPFTGRAVTRDKDGRITGKTEFQQGLRHGTSIRWFATGEKKLEARFQKGRLNGAWTEFYKKGNKKFEAHFAGGKPHGTLTNWNQTGQPLFQRQAKEDQPHGKWIKWFPNGNKKEQGEWKEGKPHGTWLEWYAGGTLKEHIVFDNGTRHGEWSRYYPGGGKRLAAAWHHGEPQGQWNAWKKDGSTGTLWEFPFLHARAEKKNSPRVYDIKSVKELNESHRKTLASLRKLHDYPLYMMTYSGGYDFDRYLERGIEAHHHSFLQLTPGNKACSTVAVFNKKGEAILGHNNDWNKQYMLLLFTDPPNGYASVSVTNIKHFMYFTEDAHTLPLEKRLGFLRAPYYPHDGMNQCGLAAGAMYVEGEHVNDPRKVTLQGYQTVRLVLDFAADVDQAVTLLRNYNNIASAKQHYLISDARGNAVVIEYFGGRMKVLRGRRSWMVSTNTMIGNRETGETRRLCWRYDKAYKYLDRRGGDISAAGVMDILQSISMEGEFSTQWSVVYNQSTGDVEIAVGRQYGKTQKFKLDMHELDAPQG